MYWPGHQVHWIAVKHAHRSGTVPGELAMAGDQAMFVGLDGSQREMHNHDQLRLDDLATKHAHGQLYPDQHLLLVDTSQWLSVSFEPLEPCRSNVQGRRGGRSA